tara:strand:+ start:2662 stop:4170 length:1509 start_codon:yes stop_codon:yes gene_type:complete
MTPQDWSRIQQGIFAGESGGDYGALFGYQNRPSGRFSGVDVTKMTVDQALDFAKPSGEYGQYVKGQVGRVATPMGAYQVIGTTLRAAKDGLGLTGTETMTPELQDQIGQWVYKTQGTGAWEGYKPMTDAQAVAAETMTALGLKPQGILTSKNTESKPMIAEQPQARGLLDSLGIQKRDVSAGGETALPFYQRDTFKDTAASLAQGFAAMGSMPALQKMTADISSQRTEQKARNKTVEYLRANGQGDLADMVEKGLIGGKEAAGVMLSKPKDDRTAAMHNFAEYNRIAADLGQDAADRFLAMTRNGSVTNVNMGGGPTEGWKAVDKSYAETWLKDSTSGLADVSSQAATIAGVLGKLEAGEELTGPLIGVQNDFVRSIMNPDAQDAKDRVEQVVQRSLRETLGSQFTASEGERLIARAYNPSLPPAKNAARLRALMMALQSTAAQKQAMREYFNENGTLQGFSGNTSIPTIDDFINVMNNAAPAPTGGAATMSPEDALEILND